MPFWGLHPWSFSLVLQNRENMFHLLLFCGVLWATAKCIAGSELPILVAAVGWQGGWKACGAYVSTHEHTWTVNSSSLLIHLVKEMVGWQPGKEWASAQRDIGLRYSLSANGLHLQSPSERTCSAIATLQIINHSPAHVPVLPPDTPGSSSRQMKTSWAAFLDSWVLSMTEVQHVNTVLKLQFNLSLKLGNAVCCQERRGHCTYELSTKKKMVS